MVTIDKAEIKAKKAKLEACGEFLKQEFIGIDAIIDDVLDYLQVWYLMPDILTRPVIINLWGMTGVGKTDLVRKMVKFLEFQDRFAEVELSNSEKSGWVNTVTQILSQNGLHDEKPGIVLFDEIQRFNTLDPDGNPLQQTKYTDFWELLSDGRLSRKSKEDYDTFLFDFFSKKKSNARAKAKGEEVSETENLSSWDAISLKANLGLDMEISELVDLDEEQMISMILEAKENKNIYEPVDHSKTLIIISGNLDEAFEMAQQTSEADIDADIYHAFTKKITMVDIKNALAHKFRPEQVARFGNIHLIYNSLRRVDFEGLIQKEINRIAKGMKEKVGITLEVGSAVNELIYRNGVFPVQGVRPVFSSIIDILEANLSKFMYEAIMSSAEHIKVDYNREKQFIIADYGGQTVEVPYVGRIDKIRQSNLHDTVANISVHECGHAVVYMALTGMAPLQLKSKVASSYAGGFTFPHQIHVTKGAMLDKIRIYLAGGIAEELLFGKDNASVGRRNDREEATKLAVEFVRRYGFDDEFQSVWNLDLPSAEMKHSITDAKIEKLMVRMVGETQELLASNMPLLKDLSRALLKSGSMEATQMVEIAVKHSMAVEVREEGYKHIVGYGAMLGEE
jgi:cell division protease FtsH